MDKFSIVIPAKNEGEGLKNLLPEIRRLYPDVELIVVNDGSSDDTSAVSLEHGAIVLNHPYSMGNGAAIKAGARKVSRDIAVFMDADGQHQARDISRLLEKLVDGFDMVVGARDDGSQANRARGFGNRIYNRLASYMTEKKVEDLTSGFRAVRTEKFREFLYLLPNGFSYPTTVTMAFFRAGYPVTYVPIESPKRVGNSHLKLVRDGVRFFLIIFKVGTLYSPLKVFTPASFLLAILGIIYYFYTFLTDGRFTNMGLLLFSTSMVIFFMGLLSEQITSLMYRNS